MERTWGKYLYLLCIPLGVVILFSGRHYICYIGDEFYMSLCVRDYKNCPLGFLTFYIGHLWCDAFGFSLLSLRTLSRFAYLVAIGVPAIYLYGKIRNVALVATVFFLSTFIAILGGFGFYDWKTAAYPFESILTVSLLVYAHKPSRMKAVGIGVFTGFVILARVTMIPILMLDIAVALLVNKGKRTWSGWIDVALLLLSLMLTIGVMLLLICGSIQGMVTAFNPDNIITGHNLDAIGNYIWRFKLLFPPIFLSWSAGFICYYLASVTRRGKKKSVSFILSAVTCVIAGWCVLRMIALLFDYSTGVYGLGFPYVLIPSFIFPFLVFGGRKDCCVEIHYLRLCSGVILIMLLMMGFGSDSFPERWHTSFLFPLAIAETYPLLSKVYRNGYFRWFWMSIIMMTGMFLYKSYAIRKDFVWVENVPPVYAGLPMDKALNPLIEEVEVEVRNMKSQGKRFTFWGAYHQTLSLLYETEPAFSIQLFHIPGKDIADYVKDLDSFDYVFVPYVEDTSLYEHTLESLEKRGFNVAKVTETFVLYENGNKN